MFNDINMVSGFRQVITPQQLFAGTPQILVPLNPNRTCLVFMNATGGLVQVATNSGMSGGFGQFICPAGQHLMLRFQDIGGIICLQWWGLAPSTSGNLTTTDITYDPAFEQCSTSE